MYFKLYWKALDTKSTDTAKNSKHKNNILFCFGMRINPGRVVRLWFTERMSINSGLLNKS